MATMSILMADRIPTIFEQEINTMPNTPVAPEAVVVAVLVPAPARVRAAAEQAAARRILTVYQEVGVNRIGHWKTDLF